MVALGANLGDPARQLAQAVSELAHLGGVVGKSALYRTEPVGGPDGQPPYLNAVLRLAPTRAHPDPRTLLAELLAIEARLGRERRERWGPRLIDLDLLDLDGRIFIAPATQGNGEALPAVRLPHPRMAERPFVLTPLAELWPDWRHPTLGRTAQELADRVGTAGVALLTSDW